MTLVLSRLRRWDVAVPVVAVALLAFVWPKTSGLLLIVAAALLAGSVLAAVHHADVIAQRVGEPFGALVLALAVTVIEVSLIVTLMVSDTKGSESLARDSVFAVVMIAGNGIVGISLVLDALRNRVSTFNAEATATMLATVATLVTLTLVLPTFTTSAPGPQFSAAQLTFAALASLALYTVFVIVQTIRHREDFVPQRGQELELRAPARPTTRGTVASLALLVVALVGVVGLAKVESPAIADAVESIGAPASAVGVVLALLVLLPEGITAIHRARNDEVQTSLNLAYGSAIASIGLTIPAIALASIWLDGRLILGLDNAQIVLFALTVVLGGLTVLPGRATLQEGAVHLAVFAAFLVLAVNP